MSLTFFQSPNFNPQENTEYKFGSKKFNGEQIYYQLLNVSGRIQSSQGLKIINSASNILVHNLSMNISGKTWFLPYIHTNNIGVVLQLVNNVLYVISQGSGFAGNYTIKGLVYYTKPN